MTTDNDEMIRRLKNQNRDLIEALQKEVEFRLNVERQRDALAKALQAVMDDGAWSGDAWIPDEHVISQVENALANLDSDPAEQPKYDYDMTYDYNIHANPDHEAWADFFIQTWPDGCADRDTMAGWFANAMMAKADSMTSEKAKQPAVPEGWFVEQIGIMFLVEKHNANGEFVKGEWIEPELHGHVICELLSDMAQQKGRE